MGTYAVIADVEALLKRTGRTPFTGSTNPTDDQVNELIEDIEAEINGVLTAQGYTTVPATASSDIKLLKRYNSEKVAAAVWGIIYAEDDFPAHVKAWRDDYAAFLSRLRRGEQDLPGQLPQGDDDVGFMIVRHPTRDALFTNRNNRTDWDE